MIIVEVSFDMVVLSRDSSVLLCILASFGHRAEIVVDESSFSLMFS